MNNSETILGQSLGWLRSERGLNTVRQLAEKHNIPEEAVSAFLRYIEHGLDAGSFYQSVLRGRFDIAIYKADSDNHRDIANYLYFYEAMGRV